MNPPVKVDSIPILADRAAYRHPDMLAISSPDGSLTYRMLALRTDAVACALAARNVASGSIVAFTMPRGAAAVIAMLGIMKAGCAYLSLDPTLPLGRRQFMADDAQISAVVSDAHGLGGVVGTFTVIDLNAVTNDQPGKCPLGPGSSDAAYVMYTSGSQGEPKGVVVEHRSVTNLITWQIREFGLGAADRAAVMSNFSFDASVLETFPFLTVGASIHIVPEAVRPFMHALRNWINKHQITALWLTSPYAEHLMRLGLDSTSSLRLLITGGDRLHRRPPPGFPARVVNVYGPTEATVITTAGTVAQEDAEDGLPDIGKPIDNVTVELLDDEGMKVPDGTPGEMHISGAGVSRGYLGREALTREHFLPTADEHRFRYRTGDIAVWKPDGAFHFVGRRDSQVKIRGYRIELGEIEAVLTADPLVAQAVVVVTGEPAQPRLIALVVPVDRSTVDVAAIRSRAGNRLPYYMIPDEFRLVDEFALTGNGKIDRSRLSEWMAH
ncbi:MAG TPA: amino acid adenylation domain-containing protein [Mycobacterium sp.]|nr:amino acid adenylation domain-containing protein [Mycobacterium sp.]HTX96948.1 amino acid adenylation domain-containing protein [Mycobacterium sp.]